MESKKILLVGWSFFPKIGGVETVMLQHAKFLQGMGIEVGVLTSELDGQKNDDDLGGIKIFRRSFINPSEAKSADEISRELNCVTECFRPDLVQFHNGCYPAGSLAMECGGENIIRIFSYFKSLNVPVLDYAHNAQLKNPEMTEKLRNLDWDGIIFVSDYVLESWQKLGFKSARNFQIYNGVEVDRFAQSEPSLEIEKIKSDDKKIILFPSRIFKVSTAKYSDQKNFYLVLEACRLLKGKRSNFILVAILDEGEQSKGNLNDLRNKIMKLGLNGLVNFIPSVSPEKMPEYYMASDIVCIPSINEAFSLSYIEAMAAGKIAIGSKTGGTVELIKDGDNGFLVSPEDPQQLAEILEKLITDDQYYSKIAASGYKTAKSFDLKFKITELYEVYIELLTKSR